MKNVLRYAWIAAIMALPLARQPVDAQGLLEDYTGDGALLVDTGGFLRTNITKGNIAFSYVLMRSASPWYFAGDASLGIANGLVSAIRSGDAQLSAKGSFALGYFLTSNRDPSDAWLALRFSGERRETSLYDANRNFGDRVYASPFTRGSASLHYMNFSGGSTMLGFSAGYAHEDNSDIADKVTVATAAVDSATGTTEIVTTDRKDAIPIADYKTFDAWKVNADVVHVLVESTLAMQGYIHYTSRNGANALRIGLGLFALSGENPFKDNAGGIVIETVNADGMNSGKLSDHIRVSLVGSLKLP